MDNALDYGLTEQFFWDSTLAEVNRAVDSIKRRTKQQQQEKASFDYILANAIGQSVARLFSNSATMPDISEFYPTLFDSEEIKQQKQEQKTALSVARFKQFADNFNNKKGGQ